MSHSIAHSGKYGFSNHILPLESGFLTRTSEKKGPNFLGSKCPIFKFTYLESSHQSNNLAKTEFLFV